jgi:hypothetical protein
VKAISKDPGEGKAAGLAQGEIRTCPACGTKFSTTGDSGFCPVCVLLGAAGHDSEELDPAPGSEHSSADTERGSIVRRFENYEVMPGRPLMKTLRVFISSTGDVQKERHLAERVMRSIAAEFNLPVSTSCSIFQRLAEENGASKNGAPKIEPDDQSPLVLCPYFLDYQKPGMEVGSGTIPNTGKFDLVISILWSRLGNLLSPTLRMPDGSTPVSGSDYEIGWALDQAGRSRGVPRLRVFRNCSNPTPPLEPKEEREAFGRRWDSVQEFFAHWKTNSDGDGVGTFNSLKSYSGDSSAIFLRAR